MQMSFGIMQTVGRKVGLQPPADRDIGTAHIGEDSLDKRIFVLGGVLAVLGIAYGIFTTMNPPDLATRAERACQKEYGNGPGVGSCTVDLIMRGSSDREKVDNAYRNMR
jgi:hypothetical protein